MDGGWRNNAGADGWRYGSAKQRAIVAQNRARSFKKKTTQRLAAHGQLL